jgi:hypothetical protein
MLIAITSPHELGVHNRLRSQHLQVDGISGQILAIPGVERTNTALVMRELVNYRITPLLRRCTQQGPR